MGKYVGIMNSPKTCVIFTSVRQLVDAAFGVFKLAFFRVYGF